MGIMPNSTTKQQRNNTPETLRQRGAPACNQLIAQCCAQSVDRIVSRIQTCAPEVPNASEVQVVLEEEEGRHTVSKIRRVVGIKTAVEDSKRCNIVAVRKKLKTVNQRRVNKTKL
ncbi:hypothetical protein E2C01_039786 [Portunus trituberculatus]|uniref:Uncharacterized protein n=1 Tax=Portunus trituberculatus TaxID=210409 RepID=A0A5B7FL32_PORTR|nr:hypothetical protein [Portunus trituberculatus]